MTTSSNNHDFSWYLPLILDFVCLLALGTFLLSVVRFGSKAYGTSSFLMIIVLTLSYVGYPVTNIYTFCYSKDQEEQSPILGSIAVAVSTFNLYWTAAFAYFAYRVSQSFIPRSPALESLNGKLSYANSDSDPYSELNLNFKKIITLLALACILPTLLFPFLIYLDVWGDRVHFILRGLKTIGCYIDDESSIQAKVFFIIVRDIIGRLIPTLVTPIYYFKLYNLSQDSRDTKGLSKKALLWLSIASTIPFFCAIPAIFVDFSNEFKSFYSSLPVTTAIVVLRYFWEFLNLLAFSKNFTKEQTSSERSPSRSPSRTRSISRTSHAI